MVRMICIVVTVFILQVLFGALAGAFQLTHVPFLLLPIVVFYGAYYQTPMESFVTCLLVGLLIDILVPMPVGVNLFLAVFMWAVGRLVIGWIGQVDLFAMLGLLYASSTLCRILFYFIYIFIFKKSISFQFYDTFFSGILDAGLGVLLIRIWNKIFIWFKISISSKEDNQSWIE